MRVGAMAENVFETMGLMAGMVPTPFVDTVPTVGLARTVMVATRLGVFEALAAGPAGAAEVAVRCGTDARATGKLLNALTGADYVRPDGDGRFALSPASRKWLLRDSPQSLYQHTLFLFVVQGWVEHYEEFVRTGRPVDMHQGMKDAEWALYQGAMRELATFTAQEVALRAPVPGGARDMLDIGGSHGFYSVSICRRRPTLRATVLDLPEAVRHAAPILAREEMGDRVVHRAADAVTADLGTNAFDFVFIGNLLHHFDAETNRDLTRRITRALRPGGVFAAFEVLRPRVPQAVGQMEILADLFFAVTSKSGTWSAEEIAGWQRDAGLVPQRARRMLTAPGFGLQAARKPRG